MTRDLPDSKGACMDAMHTHNKEIFFKFYISNTEYWNEQLQLSVIYPGY